MIFTLRAYISIAQQIEIVLIEDDYFPRFSKRYSLGRFYSEPIDITDRYLILF